MAHGARFLASKGRFYDMKHQIHRYRAKMQQYNVTQKLHGMEPRETPNGEVLQVDCTTCGGIRSHRL